jgi:hypothetical protein
MLFQSPSLIPEGQSTLIVPLILLAIIAIIITLPLMVKYCHLASDVTELGKQHVQFYLLTPAYTGIHC